MGKFRQFDVSDDERCMLRCVGEFPGHTADELKAYFDAMSVAIKNRKAALLRLRRRRYVSARFRITGVPGSLNKADHKIDYLFYLTAKGREVSYA